MTSQGHWTEEQYVLLSDQTQGLLEYADGRIELIPVPTDRHQAIVEFLFLALRTFILPHGGKIHFAPLRLRLRAGIPEYLIVDRTQERITVLSLRDDAYEEHGSFGRGSPATSPLLGGFAVEVDAVFDAS